jgi:hypothetical protein
MALRNIYDATGSIVRQVQYNDPDDISHGFKVRTSQDVSGVLRQVREARGGAHQQHKDMRLAAKVPMAVIEEAMRIGAFNDRNYWKKWLSDPANRAFRVWEGKI